MIKYLSATNIQMNSTYDTVIFHIDTWKLVVLDELLLVGKKIVFNPRNRSLKDNISAHILQTRSAYRLAQTLRHGDHSKTRLIATFTRPRNQTINDNLLLLPFYTHKTAK